METSGLVNTIVLPAWEVGAYVLTVRAQRYARSIPCRVCAAFEVHRIVTRHKKEMAREYKLTRNGRGWCVNFAEVKR